MQRTTFWLLGALAAAVGLYLYSRTQSGQSALAYVSDVLGGFMTPRGIRNHNPGNIERSSIAWQGALTLDQVNANAAAHLEPSTWDATFVQFDTPASGVRAIGHVIRAKAARGLTSVDAIIRDYSTTDQDAYVTNVAEAIGVDPAQEIDVSVVLPTLAAAIIQQENGEQPYSLSDLANWVYS